MKYVDNGYRYDDLNFKNYHLLFRNSETCLYLERDENFHQMFWILSNNPRFKSNHAYNLTNAKEGCKNFYLTWMNSDEVDINKIRYPEGSTEVAGALF